jgi:hypothetical protein
VYRDHHLIPNHLDLIAPRLRHVDGVFGFDFVYDVVGGIKAAFNYFYAFFLR